MCYPTAEHAFQAMKTNDKKIRDRFCCQPVQHDNILLPSEAKLLGRKLNLRDDWEDIKFNVMLEIVYNKFNSSRTLRDSLIATGDMLLVEGNWWGDTIWGVSNGKGQNRLGRILMDVRTVLG